MTEHDQHCALDPLAVHREQTEDDERHVRDRRISDQLLHVALNQRDKAGVNHRDRAQHEHQRNELRRAVGEHWQREADEAVASELQKHAGQDDRASCRRLHVRVGKPGVDRPHRQLHREAGEEGEEQQGLGSLREIVGHQRRDDEVCAVPAMYSMAISISTEPSKRVEEELVAGLDPLGAAPDADDQVHRDQAAFEEDVEEEQVLRREGAHDERLHQQEISHIFGHALLDRAPASADTDRHQESGEHDQQQGDAVDAERPADPSAERQPSRRTAIVRRRDRIEPTDRGRARSRGRWR